MKQAPSVELAHLTKRFGAVVAVDDLNLTVREGEFFSLLGPSGCGKTTTLRLIGGLESPDEGNVLISGEVVTDHPPYERSSNIVFQNYALFPHLTVTDNIAFGLRVKSRRVAEPEIEKLVEEALRLVHLEGFGSRRPNQLSGGQQQRIALARALVLRPKVLLLDEPLGALDKKLREQMQLELRVLQQTVGITFIYVTHDQEEALTMSDRIAVMSEGRVLQVESPMRLYEAPNCRFVADFIGNMNFFDGTVRAVADGAATVDAGPLGEIRASAKGAARAPGSPVLVAIRPERIALEFEAPGGAVNVVEGRMGTSAYLGDRSHFYVKLAGREAPVAVAAQNRERVTSRIGTAEKAVWLTWSDDAVVLLDPE